MAEDSEHDVLAVERLWGRQSGPNALKVVTDGQACLDFVFGRGECGKDPNRQLPGVLLLDINLPIVDGFSVLRQIRATPVICRLPVIMFTSSSRPEDKLQAYDLGANAFIIKPMGAENLGRMLDTIQAFWGLTELPYDA
jgi:CheY-like chemotaxis protein